MGTPFFICNIARNIEKVLVVLKENKQNNYMKSYIKEAIVIAIGLIFLGLFVKIGLSNFSSSERVVTVKGLAEKEVKANRVTWPLTYKISGNNLVALYSDLKKSNEVVKSFLLENGINKKEISENAPLVYDTKVEHFNTNSKADRYTITSVITVTSNKVDLVRSLIPRVSELLKKGIAICMGNYENRVSYEFTDLNKIKPLMIKNATINAREAAEKFAEDSNSRLGAIKTARQGSFSITDRDIHTPYIKHIRVVTTINYFMK